MKNAAVFDMDGTILNTLDDLMDSTNFALKNNGLKERSLEEIRFFVGNGIQKLIERAVPQGTSKEVFEKVFADFKSHYKIHCADKTSYYDGIPSVIQTLRKMGVKTAVVSNKADFAVQELVEVYFKGLFDVALGEKTGVSKKPSPDMVNAALSVLGVEKESAFYIGDSDVDFETAKNSSLDFIGVSWGFRGRKFLEDLGSKNIIDSPCELLKFFQ
ncbi:MAG: HAD family hydrolase [Treponema sp.]|nr:HAD family hydrolase [Treponema sp.]MDY5764290.1 HAD family hydrolase [Treponema sp.]